MAFKDTDWEYGVQNARQSTENIETYLTYIHPNLEFSDYHEVAELDDAKERIIELCEEIKRELDDISRAYREHEGM